MFLKKIVQFLEQFKKKKRKKQKINKIILNKVEQTTFIKKRKQLVFKNIDFSIFLGFIKKRKLEKYSFFIVLGIISLLFLYIKFGPTFKIKYIEIIKQDNITNMNIAYKATDKYRGKNIFSIKENDILKNLRDYQQNIKTINTNIKIPNTLKINISSFKPIFNTTIKGKTFLITENGVFIPSKYSDNLRELILIKNFKNNYFIDYKKVLDTDFILKIKSIIEKTKENIIDLKIKELKYYVIERELHIKTNKDTILIFDLNSEINEQIKKISIFNKDKINISKSNLIYIDLRIKNKIFYCDKEEKYSCLKNLKSIYKDKF